MVLAEAVVTLVLVLVLVLVAGVVTGVGEVPLDLMLDTIADMRGQAPSPHVFLKINYITVTIITVSRHYWFI